MDLKNKLKDLPPIYYLNLDHRDDRRKYMESQFNYWGIKNYYRVSSSKYLPEKVKEWIDFIHDKKILDSINATSCHLNHIDTIIKWYDSNISQTCIMMEDDLCLENISHWNFDWEYFKNNLPENWESIQLYFCRKDFLPMFLHKRLPFTWSTAAYLINRSYGKKIKKLFITNNKYKLIFYSGLYQQKIKPRIADDILFEVGTSYSTPLFGVNYELEGDNKNNDYKINPIDLRSTRIINSWWKNEHHNYSLDDFFTYGKPNDKDMIRNLNFTYSN